MPAPYERFQADWFRLDGKAAAMTGANQNLGIAHSPGQAWPVSELPPHTFPESRFAAQSRKAASL